MYILILVTTKDSVEAQKIAKKLLQDKLIACANVVTDDVKSFFWWEGKIDFSQEALLVMKSKKSLFNKIEKAVKSLHSYKVPEIIAIPIIVGSKDYLNWIDSSLLQK